MSYFKLRQVYYKLQQNFITNCDSVLLHITVTLLQITAKYYHKLRQLYYKLRQYVITNYGSFIKLLQITAAFDVIINYGRYYKLRRYYKLLRSTPHFGNFLFRKQYINFFMQ